ncbi:hypothetical protein [Flavobacterium taihuense]|uniref:Phage protein n=1 Tax=Flavobacterium taihuense TaxID=2857508 RepID=A0ABS6XSY8_9FLAO|nr:hypothetical protein [Flavobacterium taihuense]MBW4359792.1 hypothetical protein [Flavobacterium taihuense]
MKIEISLSIVIAISTVLYTVISLMLWYESRKSRKQKIEPHIVAFLKSSENHKTLELHIKNIGEGHAKNVNILVLHDYNQFGKELKSLSNLGAMKNGFNSFPPEYEIKYYVHDYSEIYDNDKNEFIKLKIDYKGTDNRKFTEEFHLPFNQLFGQNYSNPPETFIGQIPFYLNEINTTLKNKKI